MKIKCPACDSYGWTRFKPYHICGRCENGYIPIPVHHYFILKIYQLVKKIVDSYD